jgi:hypothetical protein
MFTRERLILASQGKSKSAGGLNVDDIMAYLKSVNPYFVSKPQLRSRLNVMLAEALLNDEKDRSQQAEQDADTGRAADASRRARQEADARRARQEADARRARQEADAIRRARQEADAIRRARQEADAIRRARQEVDARRARQEVDARRARQEVDARRARQEADAMRARFDTGRRAQAEARREHEARRAQAEARREQDEYKLIMERIMLFKRDGARSTFWVHVISAPVVKRLISEGYNLHQNSYFTLISWDDSRYTKPKPTPKPKSLATLVRHLNINELTKSEDIKKLYKNWAKINHPDKVPKEQEQGASALFAEVSVAYTDYLASLETGVEH